MDEKYGTGSSGGCNMSSGVAISTGLLFVLCVIGVGVVVYFATSNNRECDCALDEIDSPVKVKYDLPLDDKPKILVSTHWLKSKLCEASRTAEATIRVIEVAMGEPDDEQSFYENHIPNAVYSTVRICANATELFPINLPEPECLEKHIQSMGINADTHVVIYDRLDRRPSSREWWIFKLYSHANVSILDGGLTKWMTDGYETTNANFTPLVTDYKTAFLPERIRHMDAMEYNLKTKAEQVADARSEEVYNGTISDKGLKKGHIPGAKNIPLSYLFEENMKFKSPDALKQVAMEQGIDVSKPVVTMCRTGMQASVLAVALQLTRTSTVSIYYGSWSEWSQLADDDYIALGYN